MKIALLTAAGYGSRMGRLNTPKQFMLIDKKPLIIYTMECFQIHSEIDAIMVVTLPDWIEKVRTYALRFGITKLRWLVPGGDSGQESIYKGLAVLGEECEKSDIILVHDGNRCFVSEAIISDSLATFYKYGGAVAAIPCNEAVLCSKDGITSVSAQPREQLFRTQTPHTYTLEQLLWAHQEAKKKGIKNSVATCTLMQQLGKTIFFSKGSETNIKITRQEDVAIFKALLHEKQNRGL